jgi:hypothetical protein
VLWILCSEVLLSFFYCILLLCREDALLLLQRPLSQQLELLHLWHAALSTYLATFLQQFKETGGRVLLAAGDCCWAWPALRRRGQTAEGARHSVLCLESAVHVSRVCTWWWCVGIRVQED